VDQTVYRHLQRLAREGKTATYAVLAALTGLDVAKAEDRRRLADLLREVSVGEHRQRRPMLSVVVVLRRRGTPGRGFFDLARELGRYDGSDPQAFWTAELNRVYDEWRSPERRNEAA
jgi:hypothetical protein